MNDDFEADVVELGLETPLQDWRGGRGHARAEELDDLARASDGAGQARAVPSGGGAGIGRGPATATRLAGAG